MAHRVRYAPGQGNRAWPRRGGGAPGARAVGGRSVGRPRLTRRGREGRAYTPEPASVRRHEVLLRPVWRTAATPVPDRRPGRALVGGRVPGGDVRQLCGRPEMPAGVPS